MTIRRVLSETQADLARLGDLLIRVTRVSVETQAIVAAMRGAKR
jgi:hypothetical protein